MKTNANEMAMSEQISVTNVDMDVDMICQNEWWVCKFDTAENMGTLSANTFATG